MKNYEKYADKIKNYKGTHFCKDFIEKYIIKPGDCNNINCTKCKMIQMIWLLEDYEEPETDGNKVEVDTPILVSDIYKEKWHKRYFAKYEDGTVYTWDQGRTSWNKTHMVEWAHAKLIEDKEKE